MPRAFYRELTPTRGTDSPASPGPITASPSVAPGVFPSGGDSSRSICAWCKTVLREGTEPVSHGICEACTETLRNTLGETWRHAAAFVLPEEEGK